MLLKRSRTGPGALSQAGLLPKRTDRTAMFGSADLIPLFVELRPEIERLLRRRAGCPHLAADMASELYLKLVHARNFEGTPVKARRYLFRMAANHATDYFRVEKRRAELLKESAPLFDEVTPSPENGTIARSELRVVEAALAELPEKMRRMLVHSRVEGLTHAEIAEKMGVSRSLVEKYVLRALLHCRERMQALNDQADRLNSGEPDAKNADSSHSARALL